MKAGFLIIPMILLAACQPVELEEFNYRTTPGTDKESTEPCTLTVNATKDDAQTKALDLISGTAETKDRINAYWKNGEAVKVFRNGTCIGTLTASCTGDRPTSATLTGKLTVTDLKAKDVLTLLLPRESWDYTGQNGALTGTGSIEDTWAYATATVTVNNIGTTAASTADARFQNQQSIYRFNFKNGDAALSVKSFVLSSATERIVSRMALGGEATPGSLTVTPASATSNLLYVAIRNSGTADDTYHFQITGEDDALYMASQLIPASALASPGRFISAKNINAVKYSLAQVGEETTTSAL